MMWTWHAERSHEFDLLAIIAMFIVLQLDKYANPIRLFIFKSYSAVKELVYPIKKLLFFITISTKLIYLKLKLYKYIGDIKPSL